MPATHADTEEDANIRAFILAKLEEREAVYLAEGMDRLAANQSENGLTLGELRLQARHEGSKAALAEAAGMSPHKLSRRFAGDWSFQPHELRQIAAYFGVTVDEMMKGTPPKRKGPTVSEQLHRASLLRGKGQRGTCPRCGRAIGLTRSGAFYSHVNHSTGEVCSPTQGE